MGIPRRDLLRLTAPAALAAAIQSKAGPAPAPDGEWRNRQPGMSYRKLGRTGYMISEVVMGGNTISPERWEHVLEAIDRGLNYLDTAPAYGQTAGEQGYAKVLKARPRDKVFLTTKVSLWDLNRNDLYQKIFESLPGPEQKELKGQAADYIAARGAFESDYVCDYFAAQRGELERAALANVMEARYGRGIDRAKNYRQLIIDSAEASLKRLGTDHLDLLMCPHGASTGHELLHFPEILEAFETLKKAGKVRHLGVSAHNDPAGILEAAVKSGHYSAAMVAYNIVNRRYVDRSLEAAHRAGVGVIAMKVARPVYNGRGKGIPDDPARVRLIEEAVPGPLKVPQKAYVWALRSPHLSAVVSEMTSSALVADNLPLGAPKKG